MSNEVEKTAKPVVAATPNVVVDLVEGGGQKTIEAKPEKPKMTAQQKRRYWTSLSLIPFVIVPFVAAALYFLFFSSDRYASEVKFTIRAQGQTAPANDLLGAFTGVTGSGSTKTDSYIIVDFLHSRELVEVLEKEIDIRNIYGNSSIDWWSRFNKSGTQEDFVSYLDWRIDVSFDTSSQIITVEAQAFSPEEAQLVASKILELSENLINRLSDKAREDTLQSAQNEVNRAEEHLKLQRKKISQFRQIEQDIDPTKTVETQQLILGQVQGELGAAQARLRSMSKFMQEDAPSMKVLRSKIAALESQLTQELAKLGLGNNDNLGGGNKNTLTSRVGAYEELAVDLEFLQQAYVLSLASLERARVEADSQLRYIATFVTPRAPGEAKYPKRVLNTFLVLIFSFMIWGIGIIAFYIVREHVT